MKSEKNKEQRTKQENNIKMEKKRRMEKQQDDLLEENNDMNSITFPEIFTIVFLQICKVYSVFTYKNASTQGPTHGINKDIQ